MRSPKRRCPSFQTTAALSLVLNYSLMVVRPRFKSCVPSFRGDAACRVSPSLLPFPHQRVEHPRGFVADALIEGNGPVVGFGHGQRDEMESSVAEIPG